MKAFPCLLLLFLLGACQPPEKPAARFQPPPAIDRQIVFRNVNVITMVSDTVLPNRDVAVKNGIITAIVATGRSNWNTDALVIDAAGKYLLPGLAEMHAHVPPVDDLEPMQEVLMLFALNGVTTIRGMHGHPKHLDLRAKLRSGEIFGPRFYTSGPPLAGDDIKTPEQAAEAVRAQKQAGYDFLKILMPPLSKACFDATVTTAREVGIPFAGHVPSTVGVYAAIEAGYATIDHLDGFVESLVPGIENLPGDDVGLFGLFVADRADTARIPALVSALHDRHIWVVPTQSLGERWFTAEQNSETFQQAPEMVYMEAKELEEWDRMRQGITTSPKYAPAVANRFNQLRRRLILECQRHDVGLLLGSDAPQVYNVPGFSVHHELQYLVDAGLTPYEALRTGTANVGRFFGTHDLGVIKTGAVSDLVLLGGNPLADISQSGKVEGVLLGNRWLSKEYIGQTLRQMRKR